MARGPLFHGAEAFSPEFGAFERRRLVQWTEKGTLRMSKTGLEFSIGDHVVYPAHGVGSVVGIETQNVAGYSLEVYVITFAHEKMTLRVPTKKAVASGLRPLAEGNVVSRALTTLKGRARVKRTMWSRRAQEYEAKINSGDLISIAEVVRDLHRAENQPEQSYSERQLYESALDRMAREVAAIEQIDRDAAIGILNKSLQKAA
jgi:CarD family transcriptional regulator